MFCQVTRPPLASFIEYAAKDCVTPSEWDRFCGDTLQRREDGSGAAALRAHSTETPHS
jgi:hypothetical protein